MDGPGSRTPSFRVHGPIGRGDLPGLTDRVCGLLSGWAGSVVDCDVVGVPADGVTVDALARLQLAARGYGFRVQLRGASTDLLRLVALLGLEDVLPAAP